jgi:hypothetical protein
MLNLSDEIQPFLEQKFPLLRVHRYDGTRCTCGNPDCRWDAEKGGTAGKHPAERNGVHGAVPRESAKVFKGLNAGVACGRGFVVLDIDPRNGGDKSLAQLIAANQPLPRTWQVASGGGGTHYYFKVDGEQRGGKRVDGVDLIGVGGYVLAPGSVHPSQKQYEWEVHPSECEMAPLPEWVKIACCGVPVERTIGQDVNLDSVYDEQDLRDALEFFDPNMAEPKWFEIGACIHSAGFPIEIWDEWSAKSNRYNSEVLKEKWSRYDANKPGGKTIRSLFWEAEQAGWKPRQVEKWDFQKLASEQAQKYAQAEPKRPKIDIDFPEKMFGKFARSIYDNATDKSKPFAIAAAHATCAILAQSLFLSPAYGVLGVYAFIVAEAGEGKNEYTNAVKNTLKAVALRLGFEKNPFKLKEPKSSHYLKNTLNRFNCGSLVLDEGLKWFYLLSTSKAPSEAEICRDLLSVWSGAELDGFGTKDEENSTDGIDSPRITIFGAGTVEIFKRFFMDDSLTSLDGMLSRLNFIPAEMEEAKTVIRKAPFQPSEEIIEWLCAPFLKLDQKTHLDPKKQSVSALIDTSEQTIIGWTDAVRDSFDALGLACKPLAKTEHGRHTWNRNAELTLRFASVVSVFETNAVIQWDEFEYAKKWQLYLTDYKERACEEYLGKTKESICREKIIAALKRENGRCSRKRIAAWWRGWAEVDERIRQAAIDGLERDGVITVELSNAKRNRGEQILRIYSK